MTRLLIRLANYILLRFDGPITGHPVPHRGCIRCSDDARGWLRGVVETKAYQAIREGRDPDMRALEELRAGYRGSES